MENQIIAAARLLAVHAGARFMVSSGAAFNTADPRLAPVSEALIRQFEGTGIDLISLRLEGHLLTAVVDECRAEEPLCSAAFGRVVRLLSHTLLGEVWEAHLLFTPDPAGTTAAELHRVA